MSCSPLHYSLAAFLPRLELLVSPQRRGTSGAAEWRRGGGGVRSAVGVWGRLHLDANDGESRSAFYEKRRVSLVVKCLCDCFQQSSGCLCGQGRCWEHTLPQPLSAQTCITSFPLVNNLLLFLLLSSINYMFSGSQN